MRLEFGAVGLLPPTEGRQGRRRQGRMNGKGRFSTLEDAKEEPLSTLKAPEEKGTSLNIYFFLKGKAAEGKNEMSRVYIHFYLFIYSLYLVQGTEGRGRLGAVWRGRWGGEGDNGASLSRCRAKAWEMERRRD